MTGLPKYKYVKRKFHPISPPCGVMPLHRLILFDRIGPGSHPCHHCGETVEWRIGVHTQRGALIAEHLDGNHLNNDPANIVPSCQRCNTLKNNRALKDSEQFVMVSGKKRRAEERSCRTCGKSFLITLSNLRDPKQGQYCSRRCMYDRPK